MTNFLKINIFFSFLFLTYSSSIAQKETPYVAGELILQFNKNIHDINLLEQKYAFYQNVKTQFKVEEQLSKTMNIWLISFDETMIAHNAFKNFLALDKNILELQNNHIIKQRATTPNDPMFNQQWQYLNNGGSGGIVDADIDAELAWDITTGGVTPSGDTIVVCVVDDGLYQAQQDFGSNLWLNRNEIDGNGVDDDNNGYIDDFLGYNANASNANPAQIDNIYANFYSHGTAVAGIVGAKGNNSLGVTGVNWNVKLMIVKNGGTFESQVIKAYDYPLAMRNLYNNTNGLKGAFVVAINSSWGIDNADPASAPLWCAMYDEMGESGILNAGATANANNNVDVDGDLPTGCASDYLITVTNVRRNDQKEFDAGYGLTTIDIGAFGTDAFTVSDVNATGFDAFGGTSGATPHVSGAVGLLYAAPCLSFNQLYQDDPAAAALKAKEYIMEGADANASLQNITVSGARLNLYGMLMKQEEDCAECPVLSDYSVSSLFDLSATIHVTLSGVLQQVSLYEVRYRKLGSANWSIASSPSPHIILAPLDANSQYEYQVRFICNEVASAFSTSKNFTTNFLAIQQLAIDNGIQVYPNPTNDFVNIRFKTIQKEAFIYFYDIAGKLIYESEVFTQAKKINLAGLAKGVYVVKIKDENGIFYVHKVNKI